MVPLVEPLCMCYVVPSRPREGSADMARRIKIAGISVPRKARKAQLKIRLPERIRLNLEIEARRSGRSLNAEVVWRLSESIAGNKDPYAIAAEAIMNGLDQRVVTIIEDMVLRANPSKEEDSK
jgi:plasmid stability protein